MTSFLSSQYHNLVIYLVVAAAGLLIFLRHIDRKHRHRSFPQLLICFLYELVKKHYALARAVDTAYTEYKRVNRERTETLIKNEIAFGKALGAKA